MSGKTSENSQVCKLGWFKCISCQDETAPLTDDVLKFCHYLGPAMIVKILMENGLLFHWSTYRSLTPDELLENDGSDAQSQFMARNNENLGSQVLPRDLDDIELENTP